MNATNESSVLLTEQDVKACQTVQNISNITSIDKCILDQRLPIRIKQNSDVTVVSKFITVEQLYKATHDTMATILPRDEYFNAQGQYSEILGSQSDNDSILLALGMHDLHCVQLMQQHFTHLHDVHANLLGIEQTDGEVI